MIYNPQSPTSAYTILENTVESPRMAETRLKSKKPISPQLRAPIIAIVNVKQFKNFMNNSSTNNILFLIMSHIFFYIQLFGIKKLEQSIRALS